MGQHPDRRLGCDGKFNRNDFGLTWNAALKTGGVLVGEDASASLADRITMVYRGTVVTGGRGLALVVATGANTEIGRVQALMGATAVPETPLQRQMDELGRKLAWVALGAAGAVFAAGMLRGRPLLEMLRSARH